MRTLLFALLFAAGCDEHHRSGASDLGATGFKRIGAPCRPDTPPTSECGYAPQFYCSPAGVCASACNADADCDGGAVCVGAGDMVAGECQLRAVTDGG